MPGECPPAMLHFPPMAMAVFQSNFCSLRRQYCLIKSGENARISLNSISHILRNSQHLLIFLLCVSGYKIISHKRLCIAVILQWCEGMSLDTVSPPPQINKIKIITSSVKSTVDFMCVCLRVCAYGFSANV